MGTEGFRIPSARARLMTLGVVLSGLILVLAGMFISRLHTAATIDAERELRTTTRALAEHASAAFEGARNLLRIAHANDGKKVSLANWPSGLHVVQSTGVITQSGEITAAAKFSGPNDAVCAPLHTLSVHVKQATEDLLVSEGQCGVAERTLFLTQRLQGEGGEFLGVAYATFHPDFVTAYIRKIVDDTRYSSAIYTPTLTPLGATNGFPASEVAPIERLRLLKGLQRGDTVQAIIPASNSTFANAIVAFDRIDKVPVVIGLKLESSHYLGSWYWSSGIVIVIAILSIGGLAATIYFALTKERKHQDALVELEFHKELKRQAEEASREKSEYLAIMAHEIRTSMSGVLGMAEFMLRSKLYKEQHSGVRVLYDAGQNLVQIINRILDFSKLESGTLEVVLAPFEPTDLIDRVADLFSKEALNKGISIQKMKPESALWVQGDELRIRQILANFVGNALKFTKTGSVSIVLHATDARQNSTHVKLVFEVQDTGIGIPLAVQGHLFKPFHQVDRNIEREYGGSGLGLSICKRLSDLMGGKIWLESEEGKGSRFFLELECERSMPVATEGLALAANADDDPPGVRPSILLVEDNASNLKIATMYLERDGYRVTGALDGAEAILQYQSGDFDIILMDGAMPNMDGYEATRRIRAIEAKELRKRVPIIATTANTGKENEQRCTDAGMDDFVPKPYRFSDLKLKMARWHAPPKAQ